LHPTSLLITWLATIVAIQFLGYPFIVGGALAILVFAPSIWPAWWQFVRRARWLLLCLWLVLAYGVPGEAMFDQAWAPTWEGASVANLHVARLVLMLGCLSWLFGRLGNSGLVSALSGLLRPFDGRWFATDRLVVRLSLVLERLKTPQEKGAWRQMLDCQEKPSGPESLLISLPAWHSNDTLLVTMVLFALLGSVLL
jgi:energy-coupling factor transporter transmembrane protein EcfT